MKLAFSHSHKTDVMQQSRLTSSSDKTKKINTSLQEKSNQRSIRHAYTLWLLFEQVERCDTIHCVPFNSIAFDHTWFDSLFPYNKQYFLNNECCSNWYHTEGCRHGRWRCCKFKKSDWWVNWFSPGILGCHQKSRFHTRCVNFGIKWNLLFCRFNLWCLTELDINKNWPIYLPFSCSLTFFLLDYNSPLSLPLPPKQEVLLALKSRNGTPLPCGRGIFALIRAPFAGTRSMNRRLNIKRTRHPQTTMVCPLPLVIVGTSFI